MSTVLVSLFERRRSAGPLRTSSSTQGLTTITSWLEQDSHRVPRFSVHRPREAVARSTSKSSPPWPRYLVIRSSTLPGDQYIPIIDAPQLTRDKTVQDDDTSLEFALSIPPRRPRTLKSLRPSPLQLASHSMVSLNDEEEQDPLTPTQATHSVTPKKKPRPKSTSYRVDMTPSLSHDSQDSVASTSTSISTTSSTSTSTLDSTDPVSDPSGDLPRRVESPLPLESEIATFRLQPFVPQVSGEGASSRSFGGRIWHRMRSLVVEDGQRWSCVSVRDGEGAMPDSNDQKTQTIMSYEEDQPT